MCVRVLLRGGGGAGLCSRFLASMISIVMMAIQLELSLGNIDRCVLTECTMGVLWGDCVGMWRGGE